MLVSTITGLLVATNNDLVCLRFKGGVVVFELASLSASFEGFSLNHLFGAAGMTDLESESDPNHCNRSLVKIL